MSEGKHTPGPWKVNTNKYYLNGRPGIIWGPRGPGFGEICNMAYNFTEPNSFNIANARLIATAPALLEALELIFAIADCDEEELPNEPEGGFIRIKNLAKAAIALTKKGK